MASTAPDREPESDSEPDPSEDSGHEPDPEQAKRTSTRFLWSCAWLTVMVGFFLLSDVLRGDGGYGALAWLGVVVAILCLLALIAVYVACARDRAAHQRRRPSGRLSGRDRGDGGRRRRRSPRPDPQHHVARAPAPVGSDLLA